MKKTALIAASLIITVVTSGCGSNSVSMEIIQSKADAVTPFVDDLKDAGFSFPNFVDSPSTEPSSVLCSASGLSILYNGYSIDSSGNSLSINITIKNETENTCVFFSSDEHLKGEMVFSALSAFSYISHSQTEDEATIVLPYKGDNVADVTQCILELSAKALGSDNTDILCETVTITL